MGIALCTLGRYHEALEPLNKSAALIPDQPRLLRWRCEAFVKTKQYGLAVATAPPEILSHCVFHEILDLLNAHPKQGKLQQDLLKLRNVHDSVTWRNAFLGGLTEYASFAKDLEPSDVVEGLQIWNSAIQELFAGEPSFSILLKLFDVLTRVKVFDDRKALLELPREQRLLIIGEKEEPDFLNHAGASA